MCAADWSGVCDFEEPPSNQQMIMSGVRRRSSDGVSNSSSSNGSVVRGHVLCVVICMLVMCIQPVQPQIPGNVAISVGDQSTVGGRNFARKIVYEKMHEFYVIDKLTKFSNFT